MSNSHKALLDMVFNSDKQPRVGKPSINVPTNMAHMNLPAEKALVKTKSNKRANQEAKETR